MSNVVVLSEWLNERSDVAMEKLKREFLEMVDGMTVEQQLRMLATLDGLAERYGDAP